MNTQAIGRLLVAFLVLSGTLQAQDVTLTPNVSGFSVLRASAGVQVFLTQGNSESVRIEARGFKKEDIVAERDGNELRLTIKLQGWLGNNKADKNTNRYVKAYLTAKQLSEITIVSGAQLTGDKPFDAGKIALSAKSGGQLSMALAATDVELSAGAGSTLAVSGTSKTVTVSASGGATLDASGLKAGTCQAEATSGATVQVYADNELFLKASTGGSISHSGPGRVVSRKTSLGGSAN